MDKVGRRRNRLNGGGDPATKSLGRFRALSSLRFVLNMGSDSDDTRLESLINQCKSNGILFSFPSDSSLNIIPTDVDVKVDALTKLQAEFESGIEVGPHIFCCASEASPLQINDPDGLIQVLKTCLRTSNQHLTTATLSALPPLLPLLLTPTAGNAAQNALSQSTSSLNSVGQSPMVDAHTLRQVVVAFMPPGGLIERLGDKEKAQLKARETLVILGGFAFRSGASASSTMSNRSTNAKGPETPLMMFERYLRENGFASKVWKVREQVSAIWTCLMHVLIIFGL